MGSVEQQLLKKLEQRKAANAYRELAVSETGVDFYSNDYLGLSGKQFAVQGNHGSTGSRLISGNTKTAEELEHYLANYHQAESTLLYNSGYDANIGLLSCIAGRADTYIIDELCHASIHDGIRLSNAKTFKFLHNSIDDLEKKLSHAHGNKFVVVESVYSMDGDFAPLKAIVEVCKKHNAALIVDEAHANGLYGPKGEGRVVELGLQKKCLARVLTFGKALGCHGAIVAGSNTLTQYLVNFSRSFIYTTALPEHSLNVIKHNYGELQNNAPLRTQLFELITYFKQNCSELNFVESDSPIQSLIVSGNDAVKHLAEAIKQAGFNVKAILHPTVPEGKERIRICLHAYNTKAEVDWLLDAIKHKL